MPRIDGEMRDLPGDRVDDYAACLAADSIGALASAPILSAIICVIPK